MDKDIAVATTGQALGAVAELLDAREQKYGSDDALIGPPDALEDGSSEGSIDVGRLMSEAQGDPNEEPNAEEKDDDSAGENKDWDKERQEADQTIANLTKQVEELKAQATGSKETTEDEEDGEGDETVDREDDLDRIANLTKPKTTSAKDDEPELKELSEDATYEDYIASHNELVKAMKQRGEDAAAQAQEAANKVELAKIYDKAVKITGVKHRNALVDAVEAVWKERGYHKTGEYPTDEQTSDIILGVAQRVRADALANAPEEKPTAKAKGDRTPRTDPGKGGTRATPPKKSEASSSVVHGVSLDNMDLETVDAQLERTGVYTPQRNRK